MNRFLLLTLTLLVVLVGGFMLLTSLNRHGNGPLVVHEYNAVVPNQTTVQPQPQPLRQKIGTGVNEYEYGSGADADDLSNEAVREHNNKLALQNQPNATKASPTPTTTPPSQPAPSKTTSTPAPKNTASSKTGSATKPAPAKKPTSFDDHGIFTLQKAISKNGFHKGEPVVLVVDKGSHFTYVLQKQGDKVFLVYRASNATGSSDTPSPPGPYKISDIQKYPTWIPTKSIDPKQKPVQPYNKDHKNPLGVGRIRLNKFDVSLHGTNNPRSIRRNVSHGCIRHSNKDIEKMMAMAKQGQTVIITEKFVGTKISRDMFNNG